MKKIAIIGGTGMLGQPVVKEFIDANMQVSLLVRDVDKAKQIFGSKLQIKKVNLEDINSIRHVLEGEEAIYLNLSVKQKSSKSEFQTEREGLDNILQALQSSSIKRIGYISSLVQFYQGQNGFYWWVFDLKEKAVAKIKNSGFTYSIFYPSTFMENFDKGAYRQDDKILLAGESKFKMYLIACADYAKQVVRAFQLDNGNQEYVIQGVEGFTADEAAQYYIDNYSKSKLKIMKAPIGLLKFFGIFSHKYNYGAHIVEALNLYPEKFEAEKTWNDLGKPEIKFLDYIKNSIMV